VIWVIGIDNRGKVHGADTSGLDQWWAGVQRCFDGPSPGLALSVNTVIDEKPVTLLMFSTDQAPYVCTVSGSGVPGSDSVEAEIPWRDGNRTRSARRGEVLRILRPLETTPAVDPYQMGYVAVSEVERTLRQWSAEIKLYVVPSTDGRLVLPRHRCGLIVRAHDGSDGEMMRPLTMRDVGNEGRLIRATDTELIIDGPGYAEIPFTGKLGSEFKPEHIRPLEVRVELGFIHVEKLVVLTGEAWGTSSPPGSQKWNLHLRPSH
jgi:hypothetical protein